MTSEVKTDSEKTLKTRTCWSCNFEVADLFFCSSCDALQAYVENIDYFSCLGLGVRLQIDPDQLEGTFHDLSRKFHPDFYQRRSQEEQQISLENTAILNRAYRTLKDPLERVVYLIGLVEGGEDINTEAPADLFEEIFTLQEALEEAKTLPPGESAEKNALFSTLKASSESLQTRQMEARKQLGVLSGKWDMLEGSEKAKAFTAKQMASLQEMKKILSHRAYLERMVKNIRTAIEGK
ncbi:MAG: Fe-S protein assembly co-chaperone HscB [Nitrospira sp.]|nr:Fe-S protein assembly co-chaperone HscB [Candidatus Manganitrophaceae bacterium]HIL35778.1 Fe-S protein assembly co-chaperone HscB [Candidatus Manganitrophaceae bacterium]